MTADVTLQNLYFDKGVARFFFRNQAYRTLEELVARVGGNKSSEAFDELEETIEQYYPSVDDFEGACYSESVEDILNYLGYNYEND